MTDLTERLVSLCSLILFFNVQYKAQACLGLEEVLKTVIKPYMIVLGFMLIQRTSSSLFDFAPLRKTFAHRMISFDFDKNQSFYKSNIRIRRNSVEVFFQCVLIYKEHWKVEHFEVVQNGRQKVHSVS